MGLFLSPCTKLKSNWIKELHIKPETLKLTEEKVGKSLEDMDAGEKFLNRTSIAYALRLEIDNWDLIQLQSFCKANDTVSLKWQIFPCLRIQSNQGLPPFTICTLISGSQTVS